MNNCPICNGKISLCKHTEPELIFNQCKKCGDYYITQEALEELKKKPLSKDRMKVIRDWIDLDARDEIVYRITLDDIKE